MSSKFQRVMNSKLLALVLITTVAVGGAAVFVFMSVGGSHSDDDGTEVPQIPVELDQDKAYDESIDPQSQEFQTLIKSSEYKTKVNSIKKEKQSEADSLKKSTDQRISDLYDTRDRLVEDSGYKENGILISDNEFKRKMSADGSYALESCITFYVRMINAYENRNLDAMEASLNKMYIDMTPEEILAVCEKYGITIDGFEQGDRIAHVAGPSRMGFDENWNPIPIWDGLPDDIPLEFAKEYYELMDEYRDQVYLAYDKVIRSETYYQWNFMKNNIGYLKQNIQNVYAMMPAPYPERIEECIRMIDELEATYITETERIQQSAENELAELQLEYLNA